MKDFDIKIAEYFDNIFVNLDLIKRFIDDDEDDGSELDCLMGAAEDLIHKYLKVGIDYTKVYNNTLDYAAEKFPDIAEYHRI